MKHQVNVYYMHCPKELYCGENYHKYQQELADKILNQGLKNMFHVDGTKKQIERGRYGKPYLQNMEHYHYNISNTNGMVVCALTDVPTGVDVEKIKPFRTGVLRKCASPLEKAYIQESTGIVETEKKKYSQEKRFFQLWTLKESYIKMTGEGLRIPLQEVEFEISGSEVKCRKEGFFYQKCLGEYWISLCVQEEAEVNWILLKDML